MTCLKSGWKGSDACCWKIRPAAPEDFRIQKWILASGKDNIQKINVWLFGQKINVELSGVSEYLR